MHVTSQEGNANSSAQGIFLKFLDERIALPLEKVLCAENRSTMQREAPCCIWTSNGHSSKENQTERKGEG
jgi:hypothetical protein